MVIGGGSDHMIRLDPIPSINPWLACTRRYEGGEELDPDHCLTREQALRFGTRNDGRLHGEEANKCSREPRKLADLIAVGCDPLTCPADQLAATRVLLTIVGGRIVFQDSTDRP